MLIVYRSITETELWQQFEHMPISDCFDMCFVVIMVCQLCHIGSISIKGSQILMIKALYPKRPEC